MSLVVDAKKMFTPAVHQNEQGSLNGHSVHFLKMEEDSSEQNCFCVAASIAGCSSAAIFILNAASLPTAILVGCGIYAGIRFGFGQYFSTKPKESISKNGSLRPVLVNTEVKMDDFLTSQRDDEVLSTSLLTACVAIGIGQKFDKVTGIYQERRLGHIFGGAFDFNPSMAKRLFENLEKDVSIVVAFGTLFQPGGVDQKHVIADLRGFCKKNRFIINLRKISLVYTYYKSEFVRSDDEPGTIQLFSNGMIAPLKLTRPIGEFNYPIYPVPSILDLDPMNI